MASENSTWNYARLRGALHNFGHDADSNTVKKTLLASGLEPARQRGLT